MDFEVKELPTQQLYGLAMSMSLQNNKTVDLWRNFRQTCIAQNFQVPDTMVSLQVYKNDSDFMRAEVEFTKWAGFMAKSTTVCPSFLQALTVPTGTYAVFKFAGGPAQAQKFFTEVFSEALPNAGFKPDFRPHFEVLDKNYRENLQEEIWIPIKAG